MRDINSLAPGTYNRVINKQNGQQYMIPAHKPAPPFRPRDRTKKIGGSNKYVSAQSAALNKRIT